MPIEKYKTVIWKEKPHHIRLCSNKINRHHIFPGELIYFCLVQGEFLDVWTRHRTPLRLNRVRKTLRSFKSIHTWGAHVIKGRGIKVWQRVTELYARARVITIVPRAWSTASLVGGHSIGTVTKCKSSFSVASKFSRGQNAKCDA